MSTIILQVGQCGNQIGQCFWDALHSQGGDTSRPNAHPFFAADGKARALLVDSEPRAVQACLRKLQRSAPLGGGSSNSADDDGNSSSSSSQKKNQDRSIFRRENILTESDGRGNNWALGYNGRHGQEAINADGDEDDNMQGGRPLSLTARVLKALRREIERCDTWLGLVMIHSMSGGTGSGLGCRLLEDIRERYPTRFIMSAVITPFSSGEVALQHYNSVLTLAHLQRYADSVILFSNDDISAALAKHSARSSSSPSKNASSSSPPPKQGSSSSAFTSFDRINHYIADCLLGILAPHSLVQPLSKPPALAPLLQAAQKYHCATKNASKSSSSGGGGISNLKQSSTSSWYTQAMQGFDVGSFVASVCPLPSHKFIEIWTSTGLVHEPSHSSQSWFDLYSSLSSALPRFDLNGQLSVSLAVRFTARGLDANAFSSCWDSQILSSLPSRFPTAQWNPFPGSYEQGPLLCDSVSASSSSGTSTHNRSITVCLNRNRLLPYFQHIYHQARRMLNAGAYVHWYARYGCGEADLNEAHSALTEILLNYAPERFL